MANKPTTLYLDKELFTVSPTNSGGTESFTPTLSFGVGDSGWLVVVRYHVYDSLGSDHEPYFEVIDAYPHKEPAHEVAQAIIDHLKLDNPRLKLKVNLANGKPYMKPNLYYLPWTGWGNAFEQVAVVKFTVDEPRITIYTR